jgi:O-acetyl-ADP-ribose deacetylase (regulator of RNase III)
MFRTLTLNKRAMTSAYYLAKPPRTSSSPSPPTMAVPLSDLPTLSLLYKLKKIDTTAKGRHSQTHTPNASYNDRISIIRQDITTLATDAIVNAANNTLLGGGGVDGAIHCAAGPDLLAECETLSGCKTGSAKITDGYELPARKVIHTVGPIYFANSPTRAAELLASCYTTSLQLAVRNGCRSIAFPALSTGVYGYPSAAASVVALASVRQFFEEGEGADTLERVVFCNFLEKDERAYFDVLP